MGHTAKQPITKEGVWRLAQKGAGMGNFKPAILFQDGCVLQREKPITVWGEGPDGAQVAVSLAGQTAECTVVDGKWECSLPAMEAGRGLEMTLVCGEEEYKVRDVSVGEVWIAGGQSNMEYFLCYDSVWEDTRCLPVNRDIRMFNVPRLIYPQQPKDVSDSGYWFGEGEEAWETFSAPGYAFAREIQPVLGVPVGVIGCNWGGTSASTWMDEGYMEEEPLNVYLKDYEEAVAGKDPGELIRLEKEAYAVEDSPENRRAWAGVMYGISLKEQEEWMARTAGEAENPVGPYHIARPGRLYHQMLEKIIPYGARGVLWYQGESDEVHAEIYDKLFSAMIRCFRDSFRQELPFLFVQLAPFGRWMDGSGEKYPELRRRQEAVSKTVPGVHMVSIMDLGMYEDIHPKRKKEVGERLALLARGKIYGEELLCESPEVAGCERTRDGIRLSFSNVGAGLWEAPEEPETEKEAGLPSALTGPEEMNEGFVIIQGGERVPVDEVVVDGGEILLRALGLKEGPCRVSFAEVPYIRVRIFNSADLPVRPFSCEV